MDLQAKKCIPCREGAPKLKGNVLQTYIQAVNAAWQLYDENTKLKREFVFTDFRSAMSFVNQIAKIADAEDHHPNIYIYGYKHVRVELWTHKINGLHANDFILAAKIDAIST